MDGGRCLIVLGTHRSGTSMTAGVAQAAGFHLGGPLGGPAPDNPRGFFEHLAISEHHDRLLANVGVRWHDPVDPMALASGEQLQQWSTATGDLFDEIAGDLPNFCFKDPRTLRFLPVWHDVLASRGREVQHVVAVRDPRHVAASLQRRNGISPDDAERLWRNDHRLLVRHVLHLSPTVSFYDRALAAPRELLRRLEEMSGASSSAGTAAVDSFVSGELDHGERVDGDPAFALPAASAWYEAMVSVGGLVEDAAGQESLA